MALDPPGCTEGDASAAQGAAAWGQPRGRGCAARRGRGGGGTPLPRLFFSHRARHTPLPAQAAPTLPAPTAIIRRAAGSWGCRALPRGSWHPREGLAGPVGLCRAPVLLPCCQPRGAEVVSGWHPLLDAPSWVLPPWGHPCPCGEGAGAGSGGQRGRACPGRAGTPGAGEIPCRFPAWRFVPSKMQAALSN